MRYCKWCDQYKEDEAFGRQSRIRADGVSTRKTKCRDCCNLYAQQYYVNNKGKHLARGRLWNDSNRTRRRELGRQNYQRNSDVIKTRHINQNRKRRAQKRQAEYEPGITLEVVFTLNEGICQLCGQVCLPNDASIDHIIPLSKKGGHTWENVQLAHFNCNAKKGNTV